MGWLFKHGHSRKDIIHDIIVDESFMKCLSHVAKGNVLWSVWEINRDEKVFRTIYCHLLAKDDIGWGYKDIGEAEGPMYFTCPLKYFNMVPLSMTNYGEHELETVKTWREAVQERQNPIIYQEIIKAVSRIRREKTGEKIWIRLKKGWRPDKEMLLESLRPFAARCDGKKWKIRKSAIESYSIEKVE